MSTGRNEPCPCGSGRKYKHCCADADARRESTLRLLGSNPATAGAPMAGASPGSGGMSAGRPGRARPDAPWEVDAIPLPIRVGTAPDARPVAVLVAADGLVLHADMVTHPPAEPMEVARLLFAALEAASRQPAAGGGRRAGADDSNPAWPPEVMVRHRLLAPELARLLVPHGASVSVLPWLPSLDAAAPGLQRFMAAGPGARAEDARGSDGPLLASFPDSWAAWGLPGDVVHGLFAAAARFHDGRPWTHLFNSEALSLSIPDDRGTVTPYTACVMGNAGREFGLSLYASADDLMGLLESGPWDSGIDEVVDDVITLDFNRRADVPRAMLREVAAAHLPLASPDAVPRLMAINTPAGGVSLAQARAMTLALDAVARFATRHELRLSEHTTPDPPLSWTDAGTGVVVEYSGDLMTTLAVGPEWETPWDEEPWESPLELTPGVATGDGADPLAIAPLDDDELEQWVAFQATVTDRFADWLASGGGGRQLKEASQQVYVGIVELFISFLSYDQRASLAAIHELDLRTFLYQWLPRKIVMGRSEAMRTLAAMRRFIAFAAEREGVECPWAEPLLADKETFTERWDSFPGGHWWDEEVQQWSAPVWRDLDSRAMLPAPSLGDGVEWGEMMGMEEARLRTLIMRRWLDWREELIAGGLTEAEEVYRRLAERQEQWAGQPLASLGRRSPRQVVVAERRSRG